MFHARRSIVFHIFFYCVLLTQWVAGRAVAPPFSANLQLKSQFDSSHVSVVRKHDGGQHAACSRT